MRPHSAALMDSEQGPSSPGSRLEAQSFEFSTGQEQEVSHDRRPSARWTSAERKVAFRRALAANVGNVLEWYDFAVYGYLASTFGKLYFVDPDAAGSADPDMKEGEGGVIEAFAVFGGAFLMRPLGGVLLGKIGDTVGRKRALELSIMMMALSTFLLGCLPTRKQAGVIAPVLLVVMRLIQGISVGGQLVGSFVFTIESAPPDRRAEKVAVRWVTKAASCRLRLAVGVSA